MTTTLSTPKSKSSYTKYGSLARTNTTAKQLFKLPKGALISGIYVIGSAASNAATTATIGIGSTADANQFMTGYDVKTAATGEGYNVSGGAAVGSAMVTGLTADTTVYGIYAETGTASSSGGPWVVKVEYVLVGPNETITS